MYISRACSLWTFGFCIVKKCQGHWSCSQRQIFCLARNIWLLHSFNVSGICSSLMHTNCWKSAILSGLLLEEVFVSFNFLWHLFLLFYHTLHLFIRVLVAARFNHTLHLFVFYHTLYLEASLLGSIRIYSPNLSGVIWKQNAHNKESANSVAWRWILANLHFSVLTQRHPLCETDQ